ncbi:MAG: ion channel [Sedimenticola sp.]
MINIALNIDYFFSPMHNENNIKPIIFYGLVTIVLFAGIYTSGGLVMNSESPTIIHDSLSSLYFSVVCWTTLGFGDFVPVPKVRLFAALEALLGYLSVGMLVAVVLRYIAANKVL